MSAEDLNRLLAETPIPQDEIRRNFPLYNDRIDLADMLFMVELYKMALNVHGVIAEFGVRWGRNLGLFSALRSIFEPYNHNRRIYGFDTFSGFPSVDEKDGDYAKIGGFDVVPGYEDHLAEVLLAHERMAPISQLRKFELIKGDVTETLPKFIEAHPEVMFSLVYIDVDLYEPVRDILTLIQPHITKGTVIGFDELNFVKFPGETVALKEVVGLRNIRVQSMPYSPATAYFVVE